MRHAKRGIGRAEFGTVAPGKMSGVVQYTAHLFKEKRMLKIAILIALNCLTGEGECVFVPDSRVTEYIPEKGDAMNCMEPCDMTAYMVPVEYGVTAACPVNTPWNTKVVFVTHWGEVVTRWCQDVCPGCGEWHVDVAMPLDDNGRYYSSRDGWTALWIFPEDDDEKSNGVNDFDLGSDGMHPLDPEGNGNGSIERRGDASVHSHVPEMRPVQVRR
jgi:hypothetical protein